MHRRSLVLALLLASSAALAQLVAPDALLPSPYDHAVAAERDGRSQEAVRLYVRAARLGDPKAAVRLAEIYDKGIPGVSRDYAESLKWQNAARVLGARGPLIGDFPKSR